MKKFLICFIAVIISYLFYSCSCNCKTERTNEIPQALVKKSNEFIISKVGQIFFDKYISIDLARTKLSASNYEMVYDFYIPEKSFVKSKIKFTFDSTGNINEQREIIGIPNCIEDSTSCVFNIDEIAAKEIAVKNGLEKGIKDWKVGFLWNEKYKKYVWHILSTSFEKQTSEGFRGSGKELIINSYNGEILEFNDWNIR